MSTFLGWILTASISSCIPNTTFEGEAGVLLFCVPTVPEYYSDDDIVAYTNISNITTPISPDCPENSCSQLNTCTDKLATSENIPKYGLSVVGNLCACDYLALHPDPDIQDGTGAITCISDTQPLPYLFDKLQDGTDTPLGSTGALRTVPTIDSPFRDDYNNYIMNASLLPHSYKNVTYQEIVSHLPRAVYIHGGACGELAPKCVGFHSKGKFGICQKENFVPSTNSTPIFKGGIDNGYSPGSCSCMGRSIIWDYLTWNGDQTPEEISYYIDSFILSRYSRIDSTLFEWFMSGYKFDDGLDNISLAIPSGNVVQTKRIAPTGTLVNGKPCGKNIPSPLNSITLDSFCSLKPRSDLLHPDSVDYNQNVSVIMHGTAALCRLSSDEYEGLVLFQRFRLGANFWSDLALYEDEDRDSYVLLMVLLSSVNPTLLNPSFHGSWKFPEIVYP